MKKGTLLLPVIAAVTLMSCTMTSSRSASLVSHQSYAVSCLTVINAVAAATGGMTIPDVDFNGSSYRFAQRGNTELTIYAQSKRVNSYSARRETWSEWKCNEANGQATLSVETTGLDGEATQKLHDQFFSALNLPKI